MPVSKILERIASCGGCQHYEYDSGSRYRCRLVDETVQNKHVIAPFCPLPDYPSRTIASMEVTIMGLREPHQYGLGFMILNHVATKLNLNLEASGRRLTIYLKKDSKQGYVVLDIEYITNVAFEPGCEIFFSYAGQSFKLSPDTRPSTLHRLVPKEELPDTIDKTQDYWEKLELK